MSDSRRRDLLFYARGRINRGVARALTARSGRPSPPAPLEVVLRDASSVLARCALLEGRTNPEREAAVARWLDTRGVRYATHTFTSFAGAGRNFAVDLGHGDRVLVLIAHHDAVPGSPGANDNAAAVAILLSLLERLAGRVPPGVRVRLLFTACEELGYLGAREYVSDVGVDGIAGVISLELCGIGDTLAIWDAGRAEPFLDRVTGALDSLGLRRDERYHVVGRIPVFGSDHRAFAAQVPAYGLSVVPGHHADALRRFVLSPVRSTLMTIVRRPPPFDTYHTSGDRARTLTPGALDAVLAALEAIVAAA
jgi:hypothetical protein